MDANRALPVNFQVRTASAAAIRRATFTNSACRHAVAAFTLFCCTYACAAPYPTEGQLRSAIGNAAALLKTEGLELEIFDAQKEGLTQPLMAAVLTRTGDACLVFYNTKPENGLIQFFDTFQEKDLPILLNALAVHEATHCFEQREALIRQRFDKVLPADLKRDTVTVQGYIAVMKSGALVTWGEALADIASVLYLKQSAPGQWAYFANALAVMRHSLAMKWPAHDTSAWLYKIIAADAAEAANQSLFETALQLRSQYRPNP
jgi:hypothetical protein